MKLFHSDSIRQATWLELFFDLVFVAAIGVITHELAHTHHNHLTLEQFKTFFLTFIPLWWVWSSHTLFSNRFDRYTLTQKLLTLAIMGAAVFYATTIKGVADGKFVPFVAGFFLMQALMLFLYLSVPKEPAEHKRLATKFARNIAISL